MSDKTGRPGPFGYTLKRAQQALRQAMDSRLAEIDLTTPQYAALSELSETSGLSNAELARRCFVTPQTMHQLLRGLEKKGLIERSPHPEHGRILEIGVTHRGNKRLVEAHSVVGDVERVMTRNLSHSEIKRANEVLTECYEALQGE